jgi:hypothetical protein
MTLIDIDSDGDEDILYFMNGTLYFKENLDVKAKKIYLKENPLVVNFGNNKFIKGNFIEAVNNFASYITSSSLINVTFQALQGVNNYRLGFYDVVDKYFNEENDSYTPKYRKKRIIDAIAGE